MLLALQATAEGAGQLEKIATTFGVNWPHLGAQIISFGIVCGLLYLLAYKPILQMLEARRQQIASGLANAEKIKAELARIEAARLEVLARAEVEGKQMIDEARAAAARVQAEETRKATDAAEQILTRAREAAERDRARMLAELKQEVGRLVVQTTASVTGKILTPDDHRRLAEETARQLASLFITRERAAASSLASGAGPRGPRERASRGVRGAKPRLRRHEQRRKRLTRAARQLYRAALVDGILDEDRVRQVARRIATSTRRGSLQLLSHFQRLVRLDQDRHAAVVESAAPLPGSLRESIQADLARVYGPGLVASFVDNPALIGGMRIRIGSDVYDGSVRSRLAALEARL